MSVNITVLAIASTNTAADMSTINRTVIKMSLQTLQEKAQKSVYEWKELQD